MQLLKKIPTLFKTIPATTGFEWFFSAGFSLSGARDNETPWPCMPSAPSAG